MTKEKAALDEWCKDVAPSTRLREWYGHDLAAEKQLTLLTGTKEPDISEAAVLADILKV